MEASRCNNYEERVFQCLMMIKVPQFTARCKIYYDLNTFVYQLTRVMEQPYIIYAMNIEFVKSFI